MAEKKKVNGRPPVKIDWDKIDLLCMTHCTPTEIVENINIVNNVSICQATYTRHTEKLHGCTFVEYVHKRQAGISKPRLRELQMKSAESGNVTMQIWLGKQYLGQKEPERTVEVINDGLNWDALGKIGALLAEKVDAIKPSPRTVKADDGEQKV